MWEWLVVSGASEERRQTTRRSFESWQRKQERCFTKLEMAWNGFVWFMEHENAFLLQTKEEILKVSYTKCEVKSLLSHAFSPTCVFLYLFSLLYFFDSFSVYVCKIPDYESSYKKFANFTEREPIWFNHNTTAWLVGKEDRMWEPASRDRHPGGAPTNDLPLVFKVDTSLSFAQLSRECRIVFKGARSSR